MSPISYHVGFAGLGAMGFGMATHLTKCGYTVTGYDVYAPSLARFSDVGGRVASSPAEAAKDCSIFICMVASAKQAEEVLFDETSGAVKGG